jgi:hypothetical protein
MMIDASDPRLLAWLKTLPPRQELVVRMALNGSAKKPRASLKSSDAVRLEARQQLPFCSWTETAIRYKRNTIPSY